MPVTSFLTRCHRSPEIWRLTGAAYLVISHGAIKGRTASISAADCFAPVVLQPALLVSHVLKCSCQAKFSVTFASLMQVLLYASLLWFRRISGIPTDRKLHRISYLAGSLNDQCTTPATNPVHPSSKDYFPGFC
ncbi:hypothetical protein AMECASPLE_020227 [Ameca splendens]|uniref:Uncharacterized protein n=1 Tax=Ameca splendens TaxID=208324 RepID=A0ABV0XG76_9TELE